MDSLSTLVESRSCSKMSLESSLLFKKKKEGTSKKKRADLVRVLLGREKRQLCDFLEFLDALSQSPLTQNTNYIYIGNLT